MKLYLWTMHVHVLQRHVHRLKVCVPTCVGTPIDRNFPSYLSYFPKPILKMSYHPPPHPFTSAYLCSCFLCTCFNVVPEIWATSTEIVFQPTRTFQRPGSPLVCFLGTSAANPYFWSGAEPPTAASKFEACGINYTGEFRVQLVHLFFNKERQSCHPKMANMCDFQIVGFFLMIRLLFWGFFPNPSPTDGPLISMASKNPSFDPTPGGPWIWRKNAPSLLKGSKGKKKQTCEGVHVHTKYTYLYTYTVYMV